MGETLKDREAILRILEEACARREILVLATPYLRFESSFVAVAGNELHALATMSREDALYGLRSPELRLRFPRDLGFFEGAVQLLGIEVQENRRVLRLSLPKTLKENDQRVAYRVERVGRVTATFSTPHPDLLAGTLVDLSTSGARLHAERDLREGELHPGDRIAVTIPLSEAIRIESGACVRHLRGRALGIAFSPALPEAVREPLSRWVFLRREEDRERLARRLERGTPPFGSLEVPPGAILLVSSDPDLEAPLAQALEGLRPLRRLVPSAQALKEALLAGPVLAIFHVQGSVPEERRRLRTLAEIAQRRVPLLLLGTGLDGATLFDLGGEWRAASALVWTPERAGFLRRLCQGMIRRHLEAGEGPFPSRDEA